MLLQYALDRCHLHIYHLHTFICENLKKFNYLTSWPDES